MTSTSHLRGDVGTRFLVCAASFVILIAGIRFAAPLVQPFLVAVFLAVVNIPLMNWLQGRRLPKPLAVLGTILMAVSIIGVLVAVVSQSVTQLAGLDPDAYLESLRELARPVIAFADRLELPIGQWQSALAPSLVQVPGMVGNALRAVGSLLTSTLLVLLAVIFILFEAAGFGAKLKVAFGSEGDYFGQLSRITVQVQNYLVIKTAISAATGVFIGVWVWLIGLEFPLLWGVLAFLFNFIPNLGSILAAVPAVLLAVIQPDLGAVSTALIVAGYLLINIVFGNFVEPLLMGRRFGLSTLVVFISLVFWGWVWGPVGMLFSVPLTMVVKIALENTTDFRWVAVLLGANPPVTQPRAQP